MFGHQGHSSTVRLALLCLGLFHSLALAQLVRLEGNPVESDFIAFKQAGNVVFAPLKLAITKDKKTGKPQMGYQYFTDPATKFLRLASTLTLQFEFEQEKLDDLDKWVKQQYGTQAQLALMSGGTSECSPFVILGDGKVVAGPVSKANFTFDSTIPVIGSFTFDAKPTLLEVLSGSGTFGVICKITYQSASYKVQSGELLSSGIVKAFKSKGWIGIDTDLDKFADDILFKQTLSAESQQMVRGPFSTWLKGIIGKPILRSKLLGGYEWGWDLSNELLQKQVISGGLPTLSNNLLFTYLPTKYRLVNIDNICSLYKTQILSLDSGKAGCDDLK